MHLILHEKLCTLYCRDHTGVCEHRRPRAVPVQYKLTHSHEFILIVLFFNEWLHGG